MRERIVHMSEISRNEDGNNYGSTSVDVCNTDGRGCVPSQSRASRYAADGKRVKRGLQRFLHPSHLRQYHHQPLGTLRAGLSIEMIWVRNANNAAGRASASTTTEEPSGRNVGGRSSRAQPPKIQAQAMRGVGHSRAQPPEILLQAMRRVEHLRTQPINRERSGCKQCLSGACPCPYMHTCENREIGPFEVNIQNSHVKNSQMVHLK